MTRDDVLFDLVNEKNASTIIISTVATWAARHGPRAQRAWEITERMRKGSTSKSEATKLVDAADLRLEPHPEFQMNAD
jgi:hypothetical protein